VQGSDGFFPLPVGDFSCAYCELTFLDGGENAAVGIGVALKDFCNAMPGKLSRCWMLVIFHDENISGWEIDSYGFHGDDGGFFNQNGTGASKTEISEPWKVGDVVGVGLDFLLKRIFFTRNRELIGLSLFIDALPRSI